MAQKFIITRKGDFRLGDVRLHKDLLLPGDECYGGGFYEIDYATSRLLLEGESYDFGPPRWDWLEVEMVTLKVPIAYRGYQIFCRDEEHIRDNSFLPIRLSVEYI